MLLDTQFVFPSKEIVLANRPCAALYAPFSRNPSWMIPEE